MIRSLKFFLTVATVLIFFSACGDRHSSEVNSNDISMCEKIPMQSDGIVRLSKIQVNPDFIDEYMKYAVEVGTTSLETEPGVLTMYAVADKENPCNITILETYASQEAYKSHIASEHFQKYKQGTLHMVDSLLLDDVTPLNPDNRLINIIKE
ncbi:MAG: antibiotic biosynthesis monooxygenase [Muribaculaceae bacterium]|nr:antibiotic biosynthesis monooxygenase [Muribaculaceae bacterium]